MAKGHLIAWVDSACREWGRQIRIRYYGDDGYPGRSILAKFNEGGHTGYNGSAQYYPEFLTQDALAVSRGARDLDEHGREVLFAHYVVKGIPVKVKAYALGWAPRTYYWRLANMNARLAGALSQYTAEAA